MLEELGDFSLGKFSVHLLCPNQTAAVGTGTEEQLLSERWAAGTCSASSLVRDESIMASDVSICPNHFILE